MEKVHKTRSKSTITLVPDPLSAAQTLKLINPLNKQSLELEDMKRILHRLPESTRNLVQQIFHNYIFHSKKFDMPTYEFTKLFDEVCMAKARKPHNSYIKRQPTDDLSKPSVDSELDKSRGNISPQRNSRTLTYVQIYKERTNSTKKRKILKRNTYCVEGTEDSERVRRREEPDVGRRQRSIDVFTSNPSFKDCYSNVQELIEIRKAHLHQTSISN